MPYLRHAQHPPISQSAKHTPVHVMDSLADQVTAGQSTGNAGLNNTTDPTEARVSSWLSDDREQSVVEQVRDGVCH